MAALFGGLASWVPDWSNTAFTVDIHAKQPSTTLQLVPCCFRSDNILFIKGIIANTVKEAAKFVVLSDFECSKIRYTLFEGPSGVDFRHVEQRIEGIELVRTWQRWVSLYRTLSTYSTGVRVEYAFMRAIMQGYPLIEVWKSMPVAHLQDQFMYWIEVAAANLQGSSPDNIEILQDEIRYFNHTVYNRGRNFEHTMGLRLNPEG